MNLNTRQHQGNCVLHVRQDSDNDLELLFKNTDSQKSLPFRMRNLPASFFCPTPSFDQQQTGPVHTRARSLPAKIGQISQQNVQPQQLSNFMVPNHQRKHSYDALESETLSVGWEPRTTASGQKYFINHHDHTTSWQDPRKAHLMNSPQLPLHHAALPEGWEKAVTPEGEVYFINHQTKTTSWFDPRFNLPNNGNSNQMNAANMMFYQQEKCQRQQRMLEQQEFLLQQQQQQRVNNTPNQQHIPQQMDPLLNSNSMLNNLVREKYAKHPMNTGVGIHSRVESVDSGLDGMGSFLTSTSPDGMNQMDDVDIDTKQQFHKNRNIEHDLRFNNRLPEFFDSMPGTNVDLGILESETELGSGLENMNSEVLNDVDMILSPNNKGENFLTWL